MRSPLRPIPTLVALLLAPLSLAQGPSAERSATLHILTTPEGAGLPAGAVVEDFPLLVRLHRDTFDFGSARPDGADLRFATAEGTVLPHQVEAWDAGSGTASLWVRVPRIEGDSIQELHLTWGGAASPDSRAAVFDASNHFVSVWHMGEEVVDEVGTLGSEDVGTSLVEGMVGAARHFPGGQGVFCGDEIPDYPSGGAAHSTSAWFRAERPNTTIIGWGNEGGGRGSKVRMQYRSPPHIYIDSDFSDVSAPQRLTLGEWVHVVHTFEGGVGRLYINGELGGEHPQNLNIKTPSRLWLGGWYHHYDYVGDLDEVRISSVRRSPEWIRLAYENQREMQTLVGPPVTGEADFGIGRPMTVLAEGDTVTVRARADGALKLTWSVEREGQESVCAVDRLAYTFEAGRTAGDGEAVVRLVALYPEGPRTAEARIQVRESIPEPRFVLEGPPGIEHLGGSLPAPVRWDGREPLRLRPRITNLEALEAKGADALDYRWSLSGPAVIRQAEEEELTLIRGLGSGLLEVQLSVSNGGEPCVRTAWVEILEPPASDPWVRREVEQDERPVDGQFFPRGGDGLGHLHYEGQYRGHMDAVWVRLYRDEELVTTATCELDEQRRYAFDLPLEPGLHRYRTEFGAGGEVRHVASDLVCGDVFLIVGQSNSVATDFGEGEPPPTSAWIRTFGWNNSNPRLARTEVWAPARARGAGGESEVGYWGLELAHRLVRSQGLPICILNGGVGGTRIDQHQRSAADPTSVETIYGRLLWRVQRARLTHGVRGILWHQGENDQAAAGPSGGYGWETYRELFHSMAAAWKQDYPNLAHIHLFQIWPRACAMGHEGSDNMLREVQRTLRRDFSGMSVMSTLGVQPPGTCHYPAAGYGRLAELVGPQVERAHYGRTFAESVDPPDLVSATFLDAERTTVRLEFDQALVWDDALIRQFHIDEERGGVASAKHEGSTITLHLSRPSQQGTVTYVDSSAWDRDRLLHGINGIAALTFYRVPIGD